MKCYLIRHSMTAGNLKKRYIGRTDEPLCEEGILLLKERVYPAVQRVYVSPMRRCIQTAKIIYPGQQAVIIEEFRECDFGLFENKNYKELAHLSQYQEWVDSGGTLPFPEGESKEAFAKRCVEGFECTSMQCRKEHIDAAAFVVHGGTIMSIMEQYAYPKKNYYDYHTGNGEGYELVMEDADSGGGRICAGSYPGRPGMAVPSGEDHRTSDFRVGKNYKKIIF